MTRYGFLSSYPPTQCGLATFTNALLEHLTAAGTGDSAAVVRVLDRPAPPGPAPRGVVADLVNGRPGGAAAAAEALNRCDVAVTQHEYGLFGGRDGADVLDVLTALEIPSIVVLHTVLSEPSPHQRQLLERVADAADAVVVLSRTAAQRLRDRYLVDAARVVIIPHGASGAAQSPPPPEKSGGRGVDPRPTVLTWGLIGPGKGVEYAIDAVGMLRRAGIETRYLVVGQTHPKVLEHSGERYRDLLRSRALAAGVADLVSFDPAYRDRADLQSLVRAADAVVLPYESSEQVASGVLIEALAARRPVVSTGFPHARELLSGGAGLLVPRCDAAALADAVRRILTEPGLAGSLTAAAGRLAPDFDWAAVAGHYRLLAAMLADRSARLAA